MAKAELDVNKLVESTFEKHFGVTLDRLRELAEADKDGRCVILPKMGGPEPPYHLPVPPRVNTETEKTPEAHL